MSKICNVCKTPKSIDMFYKDSSQPDGYSYTCSSCELEKKKLAYHTRAQHYTKESQAAIRALSDRKMCTKCGKLLAWDDFGDRRGSSSGKNSQCKLCDANRGTSYRKSVSLDKSKIDASSMNPNDYLSSIPKMVNPLNKTIQATKIRARKLKIDHNIGYEDFVPLPTICPLLQIPLFYSSNTITDNTPSIDRIDSTKGYTKDNVWIVSNKANRIKSNATIDDLELLVKNLKLKR
jgi:hypothetical protein